MEQSQSKISRINLLRLFIVILGTIFVARLFYLQIVKHDYYASQAEEEHVSKYTIPATRGLIYASNGTGDYSPLVLNETVYTVYADPVYVDDANKVAELIRNVAGGNAIEGFENNLSNKDSRYTVLARQVSKTQKKMIEDADLSGVGFQEESKRVYPEGQLAAQVLGFVNSEGAGQYGIESALNDELSGVDGQLKAVTDVYGIPLSVGSDSVEVEPMNGQNIVLTLDINIQNKAEQVLKSGLESVSATKGSVIVMDPDSGKILAMANAPTYDPSNYSSVSDYSVFSNRIVSSPYEPGSVMKSLTMATALNVGVITPTTTYNNTGSVEVDDATITNVLESPKGSVTMTQVLKYSFNTGVVQVLKWLGGDDDINETGKQILYDYFKNHFLFGTRTGIQLSNEASGGIISPDDEEGGDVRYANMSFGQGMTVTMLQMISAFTSAINGGTYYSPQIIDGYLGEDDIFTAQESSIKEADVVTADASLSLRQMLHDARSGSSAATGEKSGYYIGGKTGTAQVYDANTGEYSETETIGSYIGYGGGSIDDPEYVIMVRVDDAHVANGYSGSIAAAPIFTELSNWMVDYLQIQPQS